MTDRKDQTLVVYDENGKQLAQGKKGENSVELTGLVANTAYRPAQFYVAYVDGNNVSPKVALPAFQTLAEQTPVTSNDQSTGQPQPASEANSQSQKETPSDSASQPTSDSQSKPVSASQAPSASENTSSDAGQTQPASDSKSVSSSSNNNQSQK